MIWTILTAVATLVSMLAYIITVFYLRTQLRGLEKDRYLIVTNELFALWQSVDFMQAQMWLLHSLQEQTWAEFVGAHRGDTGELAFHRVGSFYDRVGTLVRMGLIDDKEILSTMGGYAIAVWQKVEPLVREARQIENSTLFDDFEGLLPACHECYVPSLGLNGNVRPFELSQSVAPMASANRPSPAASARPVSVLQSVGIALQSAVQPGPGNKEKITKEEVKRRLERGEPLTLLDVRQPSQHDADARTLPHAVIIPPDEIAARYGELPPEREIAVYCA